MDVSSLSHLFTAPHGFAPIEQLRGDGRQLHQQTAAADAAAGWRAFRDPVVILLREDALTDSTPW
jgi:hypothetical protein